MKKFADTSIDFYRIHERGITQTGKRTPHDGICNNIHFSYVNTDWDRWDRRSERQRPILTTLMICRRNRSCQAETTGSREIDHLQRLTHTTTYNTLIMFAN